MKKNYINKILTSLVFASSLFVLSSCQVLLGVAEATGFTEDGVPNVDKFVETGFTAVEGVANIATSAESLTPEVEYTIGRATAATIIEQYKIYENDEFTEYLNKICKILTMYSPRPYLYKGYSVAILDTQEINAISTPGGHIFISKGLLETTTSEDAIAAVIAHEISHIQLAHGSDAIVASRTSQAVVDAAQQLGKEFVKDVDTKIFDLTKGVEILASLSNDLADKIINVGYSQYQEYEADKNALKLMQNAGYNPFALLDMLGEIEVDSNKGWGKTHPSPKSRINRAKKELSKEEYHVVDMNARENRFNFLKSEL